MLSLKDDWDYSLNGLVSICKESKDAIRTILNELKQSHYLKIERVRVENCKFEYNYLIYEKPYKMRIKTRNPPDTDFPYMDEPNTDNQTQINTKESNTKKQIDKLDKTENTQNEIEKVKHNILIKRNKNF